MTEFVQQSYKLTQYAAEVIITAACQKAAEMNLQFCISLVDESGQLKAFLRMDDARFLSIESSLRKAMTAASSKRPTGGLPPENELKLALASDGRVTNLLAGLPLFAEGVCVGAIGVGGGTGEQDLEVAKAGCAAFESGLGPGVKE